MKDFLLTGNVRIFGEMESRPVYRAAERFYRDVKKTLEAGTAGGSRIYIDCSHCMEEEAWEIRVSESDIQIHTSSDLGLVYAFHYLSEKYLGIRPFWFWLDQKIGTKTASVIYSASYIIALLLLIFAKLPIFTYIAIVFVGLGIGGLLNLMPSMVISV